MFRKWFAKTNYQHICHNVYHFKSDFRPEIAWKDVEGSVIAAAAREVLEMCRKDGVGLGIGGAMSDEMIEWRLHQLHRTAQKTHERRRRQSGGTGVCD